MFTKKTYKQYKPKKPGTSGAYHGASSSGYRPGGYNGYNSNRTGSTGGYSGVYSGGGYSGNRSWQGNREYRPRYDGPNKNYYIRAPKVRVIDSDGTNLGVLETQVALQKARDQELDLVEISPNADPPVCRIIDFSKYLYEQKKKKKMAQKDHSKEMKEFKFSPVIDQHDVDIRINRANEFLAKGHNVRLTIEKKRRHTMDQVNKVMSQLLTYYADYSKIEAEPRTEGNKTFITIKADGKAKNKQNSNKTSEDDKSEGQS